MKRVLGGWLPLVALCVGIVTLALVPRLADAHATFDRSDPQPNSVLAESPAEIRIWFTEPLEFDESSVRLFDQGGNEVPDIESQQGEGDKSLVVPLPTPLDVGTYSVVWKNLSAADGHPLQGYFTFTVGTQADVAPVTVPVVTDQGGAPLWLQSVARWLVLLALAVAIAVWPIWLLVLWPAVRGDTALMQELSLRAQKLGLGAVIAALIANVLMLGVQATFMDKGSLVSRMSETVTDTRFGRLWLARIGLLLLMAAALRFVPWLDPLRKRVATAAGLVVAALLPIPVSLNAHASALDNGRTTALAFDYAHLLTASLWFGGLVVLAGVLVRTLRAQVDRRVVLARALPRFSATALVCWGLLAITGLYAWWLHVGSWDALRHTSYGQSLLFKLILVGIVFLIAAANLLFITRKLAETDPKANPRWFSRLGYAVIAEIVLATLILLAVGRMTSQQPGRDVIAAERTGQTIHFDLNGRDATLQLTPGAAGPNHFLVTVPGDPTPDDTETLLRLTFGAANIGTKEMTLDRTTPYTFESHGSELGIVGDWKVQLIVREIGDFEWTDTQTVTIGVTGSTAPKAPWRFGTGGIIGLVLVAIALIGFVLAWRAGKGRMRMESAGLGAVAAVLGVMLMAQGRIEPAVGYDPGLVNPVAATSDSVTRGGTLFQANCVSCHGTGGQGDGPLADGMFPKPADFSAAHTRVHPDGQLFDWIQNGKEGTDMPAFGDDLTDEQIWDLINYIQVEFQGKPAAGGTPSPVAE
ncbi:MAG TPA: copper resistance protein CopC [Thermomicrobiales bacterium]|nr:copper resistance protein CopC [Thermomicrobiales bacterium]